MSGLSSATNVTQSAIATVAAQVGVVSQNIAGANTTGYSEQTANVASTLNGGVQLTSVTNSQNKALFESVLGATSSSAAQQAISNGLSTLQQTIGDTSSTTSPSAEITALIDALQQYESQPSDSSLATSTITAASSLATTLNNATNSVQQLREQTDGQMAASVTSINSLLTQFTSVNAQIVSGTASGQNVNTLLDQRNSILTQLSQQVGISTVTGANNDMSIYTDSGVTLFQGGQASSVTFQPTGTYTASVTGNAVYIDGIPVTGASAVMPIQSGALAGLANLRDNVAVTYQTQLDQTAQGLIDSFAETDPSGSGTTLAGLFTNGGSTSIPSPTSDTGLAGTISVNAAVDPNQGGNPQLLGNGINYNYNTGNDASYSTQLQQLLTNLSTNQTYNSAGQIGTSATVSNYADASASWLDAQIQNANSEGSYQSTLLSNSTTALSNATGVNLDNEMSKMLDLENAYSATAKLLTTINNMFSSLTAAINPVATS
jgi:flagellar hook-associated protein 1 FlgK